MRYLELTEMPITAVPDIKFTKKDHLQNKRKMKPVGWHATMTRNADKILQNGSRPNFSITGNYEEAVNYAFQRAGSSKQDATVLAVDTSYIKNKHTGDMYSSSGTPGYFEITHRLPPEAFSVADTLSYKDVIQKERKVAIKLIRSLAKQIPAKSSFHDKYGIRLIVDATSTKIKNFLLKNGWKLKGTTRTLWGSQAITNFELTMDSHTITVNKRQNSPQTNVSYDLEFTV